jgi:hypothetical protein
MIITVKQEDLCIDSGKIHYFVGYDVHYATYGSIKETVPSMHIGM